jgi:ABC-2 type transport system ATP-binding protein
VYPLLRIDRLQVRFGEKTAVSDLSLDLEPGQLTGFVGPNGAGKTTTMRAVFGLVKPASGTVRFRDAPVDAGTRRRFGYMPEERGLYAKMRVTDQLVYFGRIFGMSAADARTAADELVARLGIEEYAQKPLDKLSLGNQQRVQLAAALIHRPELLVLDEPFSGLDPTGVQTMTRTLLAERDRGVAILFSSHQLDLVERICDRVAIIVRGELVAVGTLDELRSRGREERVAIEVAGAAEDWWRVVPDVRRTDERGGTELFVVDRPGAEDELLRAAQAAGRVVAFGPDRPSLGDVFGAAVGS